ncbi:hypothetical protein F5148DRAFT_1146678 [Russula earlei]|uniref:Uncharacterized protein n=1 Tax=Russula earlei TaxID=71964 RepID=A0ACC0UKR3_9AGAM|nr:hypothetical protein F5148DRAFT_1146678 [Russula earlei]
MSSVLRCACVCGQWQGLGDAIEVLMSHARWLVVCGWWTAWNERAVARDERELRCQSHVMSCRVFAHDFEASHNLPYTALYTMAWKSKATRSRIQNLSKVSRKATVEEVDDNDEPPTLTCHAQVPVTESDLELIDIITQQGNGMKGGQELAGSGMKEGRG